MKAKTTELWWQEFTTCLKKNGNPNHKDGAHEQRGESSKRGEV